jgi:hypothetical protein
MEQTQVRQLLRYRRNGTFVWRETGKPIATRGAGRNRRYLITTIRGGTYYIHRLVWLYHKGYEVARLDHKDNVWGNNRIGNLRPCTLAQNQHNSNRKSNNRSGFKGVVRAPKSCLNRPWLAQIVIDGKKRYLGYHATAEAAGAAYDAAARQHFGRFARTNGG